MVHYPIKPVQILWCKIYYFLECSEIDSVLLHTFSGHIRALKSATITLNLLLLVFPDFWCHNADFPAEFMPKWKVQRICVWWWWWPISFDQKPENPSSFWSHAKVQFEVWAGAPFCIKTVCPGSHFSRIQFLTAGSIRVQYVSELTVWPGGIIMGGIEWPSEDKLRQTPWL